MEKFPKRPETNNPVAKSYAGDHLRVAKVAEKRNQTLPRRDAVQIAQDAGISLGDNVLPFNNAAATRRKNAEPRIVKTDAATERLAEEHLREEQQRFSLSPEGDVLPPDQKTLENS